MPLRLESTVLRLSFRETLRRWGFPCVMAFACLLTGLAHLVPYRFADATLARWESLWQRLDLLIWLLSAAVISFAASPASVFWGSCRTGRSVSHPFRLAAAGLMGQVGAGMAALTLVATLDRGLAWSRGTLSLAPLSSVSLLWIVLAVAGRCCCAFALARLCSALLRPVAGSLLLLVIFLAAAERARSEAIAGPLAEAILGLLPDARNLAVVPAEVLNSGRSIGLEAFRCIALVFVYNTLYVVALDRQGGGLGLLDHESAGG